MQDTDYDVKLARARFVYEAARLHAKELRCPVVPKSWDEREEEFKEQFISLIDDLCNGRREFQDPKEAHDSWWEKYKEMGWKYGETYDPENKTHPDMVPYEDLDPREKVKDEVFLRLVELAENCIW